MTRTWITAVLIVTFALIAYPGEAQQAPTKQSQAVQFPHTSAYYHNGDSIVRINIALDELQMESQGSQPVNTAVLQSLGTVSSKSDRIARVRLSVPSASLQSLNTRARAATTPSQRPSAVVYGQGHSKRSDDFADVLTSRAMVKPKPGVTIESLAAAYGFTVVRTLLPNDPVYVIQPNEDSLTAALELANTLFESGNTEYAQPVFQRAVTLRRTLNDTFFPNLWHLNNTSNVSPFVAGNDANVIEAWDQVTGNGVNILIVDTGVAVAHPDLSPNARTDLDWDFLDSDGDPTPGDSHGTSVAGVAAAKGDNALGVAGAAFDASIVGIRLVDANPTDAQIVDAFSHLVAESVVANQAHISNNSWGPSDASATVKEALTPAMEAALLDGVTNGRNGKGVVYVWAAGNGRSVNQNVNYDGFASSRFTIAVGASGGDGVFSSYSEPGASMLVSAPSSFSTAGIWSTIGASAYTSGFGGTSSATPLVSGVVALMLEANPALTWRDVQQILVQTSSKIDLPDTGWFLNGGGYLFNHNYGFGRINALSAVNTATTWTNLDPLLTTLTASEALVESIPDSNSTGISQAVTITPASTFSIEHVEITVDITHTYRGDLIITLTSPAGTRSVLSHLHDDSTDDYSSWKFTSVAHWGEDPAGDWTLTVSDGNVLDVGTLNNWSLNIFGTAPQAGAIPTMNVPFFSKR